MGRYIDKGNEGFRKIRNGEYVDKSGLISVVSGTLDTENCFSCVTRSRRFGKSMAARMLYAYYDRSCDSRQLFEDLEIAGDPSFERHMNRYPVIFLDISRFVTKYWNDDSIVSRIQENVISDLLDAYGGIVRKDDDDLMDILSGISSSEHEKFIMIIDEWDAIMREFSGKPDIVDKYVNMLRSLFKSNDASEVFAGVYMTGILPVKKYRTESALNNFIEYSVVNPGKFAGYFGFTENEVADLCGKHGADLQEMQLWYDGYRIGNEKSIFNPYSVMTALLKDSCGCYWSNSGSYESVKAYIQMNFEGLKDDVIRMISGERCRVNPNKFQNDLSIVNSKDDVLTVLVHLGYLAYDMDDGTCFIPNKEVAEVFTNAVEDSSWERLTDALAASKRLLESTLLGDVNAVAGCVDLAHDENTSILSYNDENSRSCVLAIAYFYAKKDYIIHREFATGKGFADLVMIPRKDSVLPAVVVELKVGRPADSAISQIRQREYAQKISEYADDILFVGISYDKKSKKHTCRIEKLS